MRLNRTEMADVLGVAPTTLDAWTRQGCPVESRPGQGKPAEFNSGEVIRWWLSKEVDKAATKTDRDDLDALKAAKLKVETASKTLALQRERGELVEVDAMNRIMAQSNLALRSAMLAMPQRCALALVGQTDTASVTEVLKREVYAALNEGSDAWMAAAEDEGRAMELEEAQEADA